MRPKKSNRSVIPLYAVIGDGPVESIYFESIKSAFRSQLAHCSIEPDLKSPANVKELDDLIDRCRKKKKYKRILCIIDMDTKLRNNEEMGMYQTLKLKHAKHNCVKFFETHPCSELWFYYYFEYTAQSLGAYEPSVKNLIRTKIHDYRKKSPYCTHSRICECGGKFENAITNGRLSMKLKEDDSREYSYSDMTKFFEEIGLVDKEAKPRQSKKK